MKASTLTRRVWLAIGLLGLTVLMSACGMMMYHLKNGFVSAPPASEFGFGPRAGSAGAYTATVQPMQPLKVGPMQSARLQLLDRDGNPVSGARIQIDGGMPQHGHGLPTRPRVSPTGDEGVYLIEGLKFNMGGWWELRFAVAGSAATDSITFNIRL